MKYIFTLALISAFTSLSLTQLNAQEKRREFYISTNNLTSLNQSIEYKSQFRENRYWRFTLGSLRYNWMADRPTQMNSFPTSHSQSALSMTVGLEKRRTISDHITFYRGVNLLINPRISNTKTENPSVPFDQRRITTLDIGTGLTAHFGLLTEFKERFVVGIHYEPRVGLGIQDGNSGLRYNAFANFGPSQMRVLLGMKWNKKAKD